MGAPARPIACLSRPPRGTCADTPKAWCSARSELLAQRQRGAEAELRGDASDGHLLRFQQLLSPCHPLIIDPFLEAVPIASRNRQVKDRRLMGGHGKGIQRQRLLQMLSRPCHYFR